MYQIYVYVPQENLERLLEAMFKAGGGVYGSYDRCCWVTEGKGRFRPLEGSDPHIGKLGETTYSPELKVEMICVKSKLTQVIDQMKMHHPYEQPAYGVMSTD
ncbi:MAG: NGG1p interacting factor NIF3 [Oligoflexales bacterium]